jgi:hypothetical protein
VSAARALVRLGRVPALDGPPLPGLRARLLARMRASALDGQLACGAVPWLSPVHAARGVQLTSARSRTELARALERLLAEADSPATPPRAAIPPCAEQVHAARGQILAITAKLRSGSPADPRGMAKLRVLLSDGAGPCYVRIHLTAMALALDDVSRWLDAAD